MQTFTPKQQLLGIDSMVGCLRFLKLKVVPTLSYKKSQKTKPICHPNTTKKQRLIQFLSQRDQLAFKDCINRFTSLIESFWKICCFGQVYATIPIFL